MNATAIEPPRVIPAGDGAALVAFPEVIDLEVNGRVRALADALDHMHLAAFQDLVVAYCTLLIHYDPLEISFQEVEELVGRATAAGTKVSASGSRLVEIPTVYGGAYGPDLPEIARMVGKSEDEVVRLHSGATYTVYMLGFAPGFPYMGGLPPELSLPRLESPRPVVPEGTVAVANQTIVYAITSPGGWRWLGRTPLKLFDPAADPPALLQAGDRVRFIPIAEEEYLRMGGQKAEQG